MRLLLTLVIGTSLFSSCKRLNEQDIPISVDCNAPEFNKEFVRFNDSLTDNENRVEGVYYLEVDTSSCICNVKYDGEDSTKILSLFKSKGWVQQNLPISDTIVSDTLSSDSLDSEQEIIEETVTFESPDPEPPISIEEDIVEVDSIDVLTDSINETIDLVDSTDSE